MKSGFVSVFKVMRSQKKTILLIVIVAISTTVVVTILTWLGRTSNLRIPTLGNLRTLGVEAYWDRDLQNKTESIIWSTITPGSSHTVTLYLKSISDTNTTLELNTINWSPPGISDYLSLSWNYNGTVIHPHEAIEVTLVLYASPSNSFINYLIDNNVKQFSFDVDIATSEYR